MSESGASSSSSLPQLFALDRDVAHRLGHHRGEEDRLAGEQVHLAEEAGGAVADDLVSGRSRTAASPSRIAMNG